jgi:hypothetical protein
MSTGRPTSPRCRISRDCGIGGVMTRAPVVKMMPPSVPSSHEEPDHLNWVTRQLVFTFKFVASDAGTEFIPPTPQTGPTLTCAPSAMPGYSHGRRTPLRSHWVAITASPSWVQKKDCAPWSNRCELSQRVAMRPPTPRPLSSTSTSSPLLVRVLAAIRPEIPAPTTTQSAWWVISALGISLFISSHSRHQAQFIIHSW